MQRRRTALWWDATRDMLVLGLRRLRAHMGLTALLLVGTFLAVGVAAALGLAAALAGFNAAEATDFPRSGLLSLFASPINDTRC